MKTQFLFYCKSGGFNLSQRYGLLQVAKMRLSINPLCFNILCVKNICFILFDFCNFDFEESKTFVLINKL